MKTLLLSTVVVGLMMVFGGNAAAQTKMTGNVVAPCSPGVKPKVDDTFKFFVMSTVNDSQGKKAYFQFSRGGKQVGCTINLHYSQAELKTYLDSKGVKGKLEWTGKVSNAGNFSQDLKTGDIATIEVVNETTMTTTFANNKKDFGTATLAAVRAK
jgi:hypothetical protein